MALFVIIVLLFFMLSLKYPDKMFWIALTIFVDPGGYVQSYISRSIIGGIQLWDLQFVLLILPLISPKIRLSDYFKFKDNRWIFYFLLSFAIIYHIIIFGYIMPGGSISTLFDFLQYERLTIVGFIAIIPAYIFFKRSYPILVKYAFVTSVLLSAFYLVTLLTGVPLLPTVSSERLGTVAMRFYMLSYGYADWFISISIIVLLFKINLPKKRFIYFIGITLFIAIILTLTRRSIIGVLYTPFLVYFLHQKFYNRTIISTKALKMLFIVFIAFTTLFIVKPKYVGYSVDMLNSVISYVQPETRDQIEDGRLENDIPKHLARFKQSPWLGYGYDATWYSNKVEEGGISANDVPLTAALGMFGVIGLLFYSFFYFKIFKILFCIYKILKKSYFIGLAHKNQFLFTICLIVLISFISRFTLNFMGYFGDIIQGVPRVYMMLLLGFMLASRDIIKYKIVAIKNNNEK